MSRAGFRQLARPALLALGLVLAGLALHALPGGGDRALLDRLVVGRGVAGAAWFVLGGAALCAVGLPRQAVAFGGGYAFGLWGGVALAMAAQLLGCVMDFLWARLVARGWVRRRLRGRAGRFDAFLAAHPFSTTLTVRLLPLGSNLLVNLLAGASGIAAGPFLLATALGYGPQTVIFALLGGGVRVEHAVQVALGAALLALSVLLGLWLHRRPGAAMAAD